MATAYPGALDQFPNPTKDDTLGSLTVPHDAQHTNVNDAVEAIQAVLGINPQGSEPTVRARFEAIAAGDPFDSSLYFTKDEALGTFVLKEDTPGGEALFRQAIEVPETTGVYLPGANTTYADVYDWLPVVGAPDELWMSLPYTSSVGLRVQVWGSAGMTFTVKGEAMGVLTGATATKLHSYDKLEANTTAVSKTFAGPADRVVLSVRVEVTNLGSATVKRMKLRVAKAAAGGPSGNDVSHRVDPTARGHLSRLAAAPAA